MPEFLLAMTVVGVAFLFANCAENVNHKVSGSTESKVTVEQSVCTEANGFFAPADRKACVLCMRDIDLCAHYHEDCARDANAEPK